MTDLLPYAWGEPPLRGRLRVEFADFMVNEQLGFSATGSGEHWLLHIEKRGANTQWAVQRLANFAGVAPRDVGYAGLKDRYALTRQYVSVPVRKAAPVDWRQFADPELRVLSAERHSRKLQRGALRGNEFVLTLRDLRGERALAEVVLAQIAAHGVPNYFGEQRFGRGGRNVEKARALFAGARFAHHERSLLLSAARSEIFNAVLAARVQRGDWNQAQPGDVFQLNGRSAIFGPEPITELLRTRLQSGEIHATGPLWGQGELRSGDDVQILELAIAERYAELTAGLVKVGMDQDRRALRVLPQALAWVWLDEATLQLRFALPAGAYATVVLRELLQTE
jgi:tRNA pseudouridine13 synthase